MKSFGLLWRDLTFVRFLVAVSSLFDLVSQAHVSRVVKEQRKTRPVHNIPVVAESLQDVERKIAGWFDELCRSSSYSLQNLICTKFKLPTWK